MILEGEVAAEPSLGQLALEYTLQSLGPLRRCALTNRAAKKVYTSEISKAQPSIADVP